MYMSLPLSLYIYIYIIHIYIYTHIHIYIDREREREREIGGPASARSSGAISISAATPVSSCVAARAMDIINDNGDYDNDINNNNNNHHNNYITISN